MKSPLKVSERSRTNWFRESKTLRERAQLIIIVIGGTILVTALITYMIRSLVGKEWVAAVLSPPLVIFLAYLEQIINLGYMDPFFPIAAFNIFFVSLIGVVLGLFVFHKIGKDIVRVISIIVKNDDRLIVKIEPSPKFIEVCEFVYRAAKGVYWDDDLKAFFIKASAAGNLSHAEKFHIIRKAVKEELGMILRLKIEVEWVNVDSKTQEDIIDMFP